MKNIEVTMQLSSGNITVEVNVPDNATENEIHDIAVKAIEDELTYCKLGSYR